MAARPHVARAPLVFRSALESLWYGRQPLALLLVPFSWLYLLARACRSLPYRFGLRAVARLAVPVIVVGNLTVGGTGKTPLVLWLARYLQTRAYRPGIISRGYGRAGKGVVRQVQADSDPALAGDEPVLLARRSGCPVAVAADRVQAAQALLRQGACDVLLSDDGLQHTPLGRDVEIVVVDGERRFGNGHCLPAGPLRERLARLDTADLVVANGRVGVGEYLMEYLALPVKSLDGSREQPAGCFHGQTVHAVAAIGNPARFFATLRRLGISIREHAFPDHHGFRRGELEFGDGAPLLMTEKDAVKCRSLGLENAWYLPIDVAMPEAFEKKLIQLLEDRQHG